MGFRENHSEVISMTNLEDLEKSIHNLADVLPDFLEEFLAPSGIISQKRDIDDSLEKLTLLLKENRENVHEKNEESRKLNLKIQEYRNTLEELRVNRARLATQITAMEDSIRSLGRDIENIDEQIRTNLEDINRLELRQKETAQKIKESEVQLKEHEKSKKELQKKLKELEKQIRSRTKDVSGKEGELKKQNSILQKLLLNLEKVSLECQHLKRDIEELCQNFRENNSSDIKAYLDRLPGLKRSLQDLRGDYSATREKLKALGQVNLMAP